jgi:Arc/MetJ-type ribon-helix-helix transcriptional regulator
MFSLIFIPFEISYSTHKRFINIYIYKTYIDIQIGDCMANVLVSLDEEHEAFLRRLAQEKGGKKGVISDIIQAALDGLKEKEKKEQERQEAIKRIIRRMETAEPRGFRGYKTRSELYD